MAKCAYCGKVVVQTKGKRAKLYCSDRCRITFKRKASITEQKPLTNITEQPYPNKPPEVIASRLRSKQGSARPGDTDYPEQTGLNTCNVCGCKLKWDVLDACLACSVPGKASGRPLDGLTVGKCSQAGLKVSQGQGGAKKGITPQGGGGVDINSTPLNMS